MDGSLGYGQAMCWIQFNPAGSPAKRSLERPVFAVLFKNPPGGVGLFKLPIQRIHISVFGVFEAHQWSRCFLVQAGCLGFFGDFNRDL